MISTTLCGISWGMSIYAVTWREASLTLRAKAPTMHLQ